MAVGWARDGAVQEQIDAGIDDAVKLARSRLPQGESLTCCEICEEDIPLARRRAIPGVRLCVHCQAELENERVASTGINRRGSKDSQLK
ncbi:MAG: DksA/TraR family C4-type zinc finger protein [Desulfobacter sp.]